MDALAEAFDEPISSPRHAALRDDAWIGGPFIEGRYLLGRLLGRNFFRVSNDEFLAALRKHFESTLSVPIAELLASLEGGLAVNVLREQCRIFADLRPADRPLEECGVAMLAQNPELSDDELANRLNTTIGQVESIASLGFFRRLLRERDT